jgi:hypothetical protein
MQQTPQLLRAQWYGVCGGMSTRQNGLHPQITQIDADYGLTELVGFSFCSCSCHLRPSAASADNLSVRRFHRQMELARSAGLLAGWAGRSACLDPVRDGLGASGWTEDDDEDEDEKTASTAFLCDLRALRGEGVVWAVFCGKHRTVADSCAHDGHTNPAHLYNGVCRKDEV